MASRAKGDLGDITNFASFTAPKLRTAGSNTTKPAAQAAPAAVEEKAVSEKAVSAPVKPAEPVAVAPEKAAEAKQTEAEQATGCAKHQMTFAREILLHRAASASNFKSFLRPSHA